MQSYLEAVMVVENFWSSWPGLSNVAFFLPEDFDEEELDKEELNEEELDEKLAERLFHDMIALCHLAWKINRCTGPKGILNNPHQ